MIGNNKHICSIICGAPDGSIDKSLCEGLIICADKGLDHALAAGISPDIVVGDFDSSNAPLPQGVECIRVSPIKDDTDAVLAADTAIQQGCTQLRFFCAVGGRFDHTFANVQMLEYLHQKGVSAVLYGGSESIRLLHEGDCAVIPSFKGFVSVFAFTESAVVSESGMKYPLEKYSISRRFPLGVSNEVSAETGVVQVHEGTVILTEYHE